MRSSAALITQVCVTMLILTTLSAGADPEFWHYPEFRYTSGLPGGGWGVTPDGIPGFDGAMQLNVPVAYTPHQGLVVGYSSASYDSSFKLDLQNLIGEGSGPNVNGTGYIGIGLGKPGYGLFLVEMPTSVDWEPVQNAQQQIMPEGRRRPAVAVGYQDLFRHRDGFDREPHGAGTPYIVATKMCGGNEQPVYVSLGYGKGRFHNSFFGGASWRAMNRLTVLAEYDGWVPNVAVAYDLSSVIDDHTILYAGMVDLDRAVIGLSYVYADLNL
ncbi:MAG: hypothetical protein ACOX9R_10795 [Armatimonadota bacterium]